MVIRPLEDHTRHIVLDLRSLIWGFGENCTIVQAITLEPDNAAAQYKDALLGSY